MLHLEHCFFCDMKRIRHYVWNYFCEINGVPVGLTWYNEVKATEEQVLSQRN